MSSFPAFNLFDGLFPIATTTASKPKDDDYDPYKDSDDDEEEVKKVEQPKDMFTDLFTSVNIPGIVNNWMIDPKLEEEKRKQEMLRQEEQEQKEFEEEARKKHAMSIAKKRKEEYDRHIEQLRKEEEMKAKKEEEIQLKRGNSFNLLRSSSLRTSTSAGAGTSTNTSDTSSRSIGGNASNGTIAPAIPTSIPLSPQAQAVMEPLLMEDSESRKKRHFEDQMRLREEQIRLHQEKEEIQAILRWEQEQKRIYEAEERLKREEQEYFIRMEREAKMREISEFERIRQEQDLLDKKQEEQERLKREEEEIKRLRIEQEKERRYRDKHAQKVARHVQKQVDRQELHRQNSHGARPTISKALIQKITEVQVNEDLENNYAKKKEEEYEKIKAEKVREVESSNNVISWIVGGLFSTGEENKGLTVFDPYDEKRSPFEKHLTDVGFRVTLHKFISNDDDYQEDKDDDDYDKVATTRKAILRYDPSFNSLYIDVKVEGHSTIIHFNIVRDIKKAIRGVRASCSLRKEGEAQDKTKYISLHINKMNDVILEFESLKAANNVYQELTNFIVYRKEYPTIEVTSQSYPTAKHSLDSSLIVPTILPPTSLNSVFEIEKVITPELVSAPPKSPKTRSPILKADTIKGITEGITKLLMNPTKILGAEGDSDDDDSDDNNEEEATAKRKTKSVKDKLNDRIEWHQWVRFLPPPGTSMIGIQTKYRLLVLGSNGRISYYSLKEDVRDDDIIPGLEAMKKGMWDEQSSLYDRGYKLEGGFNKGYILSVNPNSTSSEPYMVDIRFIDITTLTFACDSESKWQDAVVGIKSYIAKESVPKSPHYRKSKTAEKEG